MSKVAIQGAVTGTGVFTLASPATNTDRTLTLPDEAGTVLTTATAGVPIGGPAFSCLMASDQTIIGSVFTKVQFNLKEFDTNTNFDAVTNYRFTPTVSGYYQCNASIYPSTTVTTVQAAIYKNGSLFKRGFSTSTNGIGQVSVLIYMNGTTDYIELYTFAAGTTPTISNNNTLTWFQAALVRSAT
jgi:hypothetical protein